MKNRRIMLAALVVAMPLASVVNAPGGNAATCAETRTYFDGTQSGGNNCYRKDSGDICQHVDYTQTAPQVGLDRTGAGFSACYESPVVR